MPILHGCGFSELCGFIGKSGFACGLFVAPRKHVREDTNGFNFGILLYLYILGLFIDIHSTFQVRLALCYERVAVGCEKREKEGTRGERGWEWLEALLYVC